jgi:DNA-binding NarL/FixJ family response regulator
MIAPIAVTAQQDELIAQATASPGLIDYILSATMSAVNQPNVPSKAFQQEQQGPETLCLIIDLAGSGQIQRRDAFEPRLKYYRERTGHLGGSMKILVVDDHALIREALCSVLKQLRSDAEVSVASTCGQAMQLIQDSPDWDLVLIDLALPGRDGFSMIAELGQRDLVFPIVVLSASQDKSDVVRALGLGAVGFIPKTTSREIMLSALQLVFSGGIYIPPEALDGELALQPTESSKGCCDQVRATPPDLGVTERQLEVLALMMEGKNNKLISRALDLAEPTVKNHVTAILKALKVTNRTEAVIAVSKLGWRLPQIRNP